MTQQMLPDGKGEINIFLFQKLNTNLGKSFFFWSPTIEIS
jgi:hypothetical protein